MRILSWNVLAHAYARPEHFPKADFSFVTSEHRAQRVLEILEEFHADVMMLQEVEPTFAMDIGNYFATTHKVLFLKLPYKSAGVATVISRDITLLSSSKIQVTGDTLLVKCEFEGQGFVLCNSHFKWAPVNTLESEHPGLQQWVEVQKILNGITVPVIFGADTNDFPDGSLRANFNRWKNLSDVEYTSLFSGNELRNLDVLLCTEEITSQSITSLDAKLALPSEEVPSDHIPLIVDVSFSQNQGK